MSIETLKNALPEYAKDQKLNLGSLAMDPSLHPMGTLFWIDASAPALTGAFPVYQRMAVALDTGGAIKGLVRADLYTGIGPAAGTEAGRVRHVLNLYALYPVETATP